MSVMKESDWDSLVRTLLAFLLIQGVQPLIPFLFFVVGREDFLKLFERWTSI